MTTTAPDQEPPPIEPGQDWEIGLLRPEDAPGVARLFLSVYGEGYPIRTYLEPERLAAENRAGRTISSVARTPSGDIVGHNALFRTVPNPRVYESGAGLVDAAYRGGKGIFTRLVAHGQEAAPRRFEVDGIYGEAVCNHVFSQRMTHGLGWRTTAVEVDLMPAAAYAREGSASGRVASLLDFLTVRPDPHTVYLPEVYEDPLRFVYGGLDDARVLETAGGPLPAGISKVDAQVFAFAAVARLTVQEAREDFARAMAATEEKLVEKKVQVLQAWLPLAFDWAGTAAETLRQRGWFLGGVLPRWFGTDGLLMQKILPRPDWEQIQVHFDRAARLLEMVRSDWEETRERG